MPKYLLLPLLFLLQLSARAQKAQEPSSRWSLGVTAGPSFPVGQFRHTDPSNDVWGAYTGWNGTPGRSHEPVHDLGSGSQS